MSARSWRLPPSPPDTAPHVPPLSLSGHPADLDDRTRPRARRTSTLPYQNSAPDRGNLRNSRNLVVVIPSPDLPLDHGHLGNVLSTGPRNRIAQGILMPLLPSMVAQLNAIAREFNFPSTVGLCLYLRINEHGIAMAPRISDISWQHLFGHLFDSRSSPTSSQLPISANVEFDIDLNKARWFEPWLLGTWRDPEPVSVVSRPSSGVHWRGDSKTMSVDEQSVEDRWDDSGLHTPSRPQVRRPPKQLSLVNRLDLHGNHVPPRSRMVLDPIPTHPSQSILPTDIPQPVKGELESRVSLWRDITELHPVSMTETYQPPPVIGITVDETPMDEYPGHDFQQAAGLDQCHWSVTSVGPRSPATDSEIASTPPSPIHINTVPPTPTTVASQGTTDDDWHSTVPRLPSPDVGQHVVEDVMPRAIWGNSFGWRTAMTWKNIYPFAVTETKSQVPLQDTSGIVPQYPNLMIDPTMDSHPDLPSLHKIHPLESCPQSAWGSSFGWQRAVTWRKTYPYSMPTVQSDALVQLRGAENLEYKYPDICIYPAAYPYFEIYPPCDAIAQRAAVEPKACDPSLATCSAVKVNGSSHVDAADYSVSTLYPNLVIYPAVYPHFDLYPKTLQISETAEQTEVDVKLVKQTAEYPNMVVYPSVYPYIEVYPTRYTRRRASSATRCTSFGWLARKNWLQVYPYHTTACPLPTSGHTGDESRPIAGVVTPGRAHPNVNPVSRSTRSDSSDYPYLVIYPVVYPHFDIYPSRAAIVQLEESLPAEENQLTINPNTFYPNLVIYPAVYPHFDLYPASVAVKCGIRESNLRRRRIETWRAKTAAQDGLLAEDHIWVVDEPLQLDLADYAWSPTSAGPPTSPPESLSTGSIPVSVHIDRRVQGSVLLTPSTATTWGPQDDDWYSETDSIDHIEGLPSPDLGQRMVDDIEVPYFPRQPWSMIWPFYTDVGQANALPSVPGNSSLYPHLVIYPPAYPHFELYPARVNVSTSKDHAAEMVANSNAYPIFDIYPAVYPHFNIYPAVDFPIEIPSNIISDVWKERVEVDLPSLYPNLDIYHPCYPYNLDFIYPVSNANKSARISIEPPRGYPWLVIYPPVYPFIIPYPSRPAEIGSPSKPDQSDILSLTMQKLVSVKLPVRYPLLGIYPAGYPWSLESIYPAVSVEPIVCLVPKQTRAVHDVDVGDIAPRRPIMTPKPRKTHMELHTSVFRCLEKPFIRNSKTHLQLHVEVFQGGVEWRPSACLQDLSLLRESQRCPSPDNSTPRTLRSRSGTATPQSPRTSARSPHASKFMIPRGQRRNASAPPENPSPNGLRERAKSPKRLLSSFDLRPMAEPSVPQTSRSEFLTHGPQGPRIKESLVMQRARLYEQQIAVNHSPVLVGSKGTHSAVTHSTFHD